MAKLENLFSRYGRPYHETNERIYINLTRADKIDTAERVQYYDSYAKDKITELLTFAELLKEYRRSLYERAQELYTASYSMKLQLLRTVDTWSNKKSYTVKVLQIPDAPNARPVEILSESYAGKERHTALKRFEELKKIHANIETEIDIEKKRWEK